MIPVSPFIIYSRNTIYYIFLTSCIHTVPTPTVDITDDGVSNMYVRGTVRSLTCNITLASYSPSSPNVTVQWMKDGLLLDVSNERVNQSELQVNGNSYTSTIMFSPLNSTDTGEYTCTGTISPIGSGFDADIEPYIIGTSNTESYTLMVQGMYIHVYIYIYNMYVCTTQITHTVCWECRS